MGRRRNIDKGSYAQLMLALLGDQGAGTIEVLANHTEIALPSTTTAITTGATAMGTISLTAKGPSNFRIEYAMQLNALNTLQAVITPTVSFTANGVDTITATLPAMAFPPNTSSPTTGILSGFAEASAVAEAGSDDHRDPVAHRQRHGRLGPRVTVRAGDAGDLLGRVSVLREAQDLRDLRLP